MVTPIMSFESRTAAEVQTGSSFDVDIRGLCRGSDGVVMSNRGITLRGITKSRVDCPKFATPSLYAQV